MIDLFSLQTDVIWFDNISSLKKKKKIKNLLAKNQLWHELVLMAHPLKKKNIYGASTHSL